MTLISYFAMPEGAFGIVGAFKGGLPSPKIAVLANIQFQDILNVMVPGYYLSFFRNNRYIANIRSC